MKSKKLSLFLFIVQFALCLSLVVTASASESMDSIDVSYTAGAESLAVGTGETVTVEISIDKNEGFVYSQAYIKYDTNTLTYVDFTADEFAFVEASPKVRVSETVEGTLVLSISDLSKLDFMNPVVYNQTGCVVQLTFKTTDADFESTDILVEATPGNTISPNFGETPVSGDTLTLYGPLHQHTPGEWVIDQEPDCVNKGSKHQICSDCLVTIDEAVIEALGHTAGEWIEDKAPTCTEAGAKHQVCSVCGETIAEEVIEALGHKPGEWVEVKAPTCTEAGAKHQVCSVCGETIAEEAIKALGHKPGEWVEVKAPTCTEAGTKNQPCSNCEEVLDTNTIEALGHKPGEWITDKEATCTEEGSKHQVCAVCSETIATDTIGKKDHGTVVDPAVAATCTTTGLTEGSHCPDCQLVHKAQDVVPVIEHAYNEGVVTTAPTAATVGVKTFTCTVCDTTRTEEIAKLAPTMVEAGDKWNKKMETLLVFRTDAAFADFTEVRINGATLAAENYTVTDANGIKVELKREYLESLALGEYTIDVASASGAASATFTIEKAPASLLWLWIVIAVVVVAGAGVAVFFVVKNKKKAA